MKNAIYRCGFIGEFYYGVEYIFLPLRGLKAVPGHKLKGRKPESLRWETPHSLIELKKSSLTNGQK